MDIFQIVGSGEIANYYAIIEKTDLNSVNQYKQNLLQIAIAKEHVEIGLDLISRGIDVNNQDTNGKTALHYAAEYNSVKLAAAIIMNGGDVNIIDSYGNNALWTATFNTKDDYRLLKLYVSSGGNPTNKNLSGRSPLDFARQVGDEVGVGILLSRSN